MAPDLRVIPGDATIHDAARRVANALAAEDLRRARQHIRRLEDALRDHGATDAELDALRYGTTPPRPATCMCGADAVASRNGYPLCGLHLLGRTPDGEL